MVVYVFEGLNFVLWMPDHFTDPGLCWVCYA